MKTINEAMKKLQEAKRISLKEAEPTKLDDIVKVDPNKKEITYPKQDKNDPRKPSDITKDELLNSDKNEKELSSTEDGTAKKEIQDMLDRSWNRKYNIGIENEDKEIKTEYAKNTKYYRIQNGKETEVNQSMLIGKLQALKTDIKLGVTLRNDYTIDDIDDMLEKVNQGESIKLFDAWYLNEKDYNGNKFESTEDDTVKKKEIQDMLDRSWNRKYNIGIENEEYCKNIEKEKCANCEESKIIKEDTEFYTDEALKVLDYIQNYLNIL